MLRKSLSPDGLPDAGMVRARYPEVTAKSLAGTMEQTVRGRDLHAALGVGRDFTTWIRSRIADYGFEENVDYVIEAAPPIRGAGNRGARDEYHLSIAMGKELAMVENNDRGRAVRRHFIECERRLKTGQPVVPQTLPEALRLAADLAERVETQRAEIADLTPKADALDRIASADGSVSITEAAKSLQVQPRKLFDLLRERRWIYRRTNSSRDVGYQDRIASGVLVHKVSTFPRRDGSEGSASQVLVTSKGLTALARILDAQSPSEVR